MIKKKNFSLGKNIVILTSFSILLFIFSYVLAATIPTLTASSITYDSAVVSANRLEPNQTYEFKFDFMVGNLESRFVASASGAGSSSFSRQFDPNETYTVNLLQYDSATSAFISSGAKTLKFTTLSYPGPTGGYLPPDPQPSPSPEPLPDPTPSPQPNPQPAPSPQPSPSPEPNPQPSPSPEPQPSPQPSPSPVSDPAFPNAGPLVTCDNSTANLCDFTALMAMVNRIINFILFDMSIPIAAIMFAYAGILLITAGGEAAHAKTRAKNIFTDTVIGLVVALIAWLIIHTILSIVGYNGAWIGF